MLANNHFIAFNKLSVVDGYDGSPVTTSCDRTVEGDIDCSKNCASPIDENKALDTILLVVYRPEVSSEDIAAEAAVAASATAEAASAAVLVDAADHGL